MDNKFLQAGLTEKQAQKKLFEYGENILKQEKKNSALKIFAGQFKDVMTVILLISTIISVFMGETTEAITIIIIVLVNALLGFIQEYKTEKTLESLNNMASPVARVIRDGQQKKVPAAELVPGDIIVLQAGDKIPADGIIFESVSMQCDEALLTGESLSVDKTPAKDKSDKSQVSKAYMGTVVTKGRGKAEVIATGMNTEMGKIADMLDEIEEEATPLQRKLSELGKYIAIGCLGICAIVSLTGILRGESIFDMLITGISLAVAAVPEGLPAIVTISLALAVNRILKRNALVRKLHSVETLGCANVICTDKTGTLTENKMTVKRIFTMDYNISVSGDGYDQAGEFTIDNHKAMPAFSDTIKKLMDVCVVCNNSEIYEDDKKSLKDLREGKQWKTTGDPTEIALKIMVAKANRNVKTSGYTRQDEIPFDSERKRMTVSAYDKNSKLWALSKGAPDILLGKCKYIMTDNGTQLITPSIQKQILKANEDMAKSALRVLGFAVKENPAGHNDMEADMVFVGMVGLIDPPRKEVKDAVAKCRQAKIRTVMITGDHKITACAIAQQVGIMKHGDKAMTGAEIDAMSKEEFEKIVHKIAVFARVKPSHKLQIVKALKSRGNIVAMTGDGVNDAPAIKEADIGVSMGITGTDVTKQASSIILLDDNFATLVATVEEGRAVYGNIRKFIRYLLSCNIGEVVTMFAGMLMGLPVILQPIQILLVNLVTDGLPALALGLEPGEDNIMTQKPRTANESIFSNGLATTIVFRGFIIGLTTLAVFVSFMSASGDLPKARTAALVTLVMTQLFHVFECKSETKGLWRVNWMNNPALIGAVMVSVAAMGAVLYVPFLQNVFNTVAFSAKELGKILAYAGIVPILSSVWLSIPKRKKNDIVLPDNIGNQSEQADMQ